MKDSELTTDTYTEAMARAAWNEALRRFGVEPQPYAILSYTPATTRVGTAPGCTAVHLLERALELAVAMGRQHEREHNDFALVPSEYPMLSAMHRERELLRTAVGLLADIQKMDGQIDAVLSSYSSKVVGALAAVHAPDPPRCEQEISVNGDPTLRSFASARVRCNRSRGRHTVVGSILDPTSILHVATIGTCGGEVSWRGPAGEE